MWAGAWVCAPEYTEVSNLLAAGDEDSCELLDVNSCEFGSSARAAIALNCRVIFLALPYSDILFMFEQIKLA